MPVKTNRRHWKSGIMAIGGLLTLLLFLFISCSDDKPTENAAGNVPIGKLVNMSSCKSFSAGKISDSIDAGQDCIEYEYADNRILHLRHINAGFNCCPTISTDIVIEGNVITITEKEIEGSCHCLCLYDLDYDIGILTPGEYRIVVEEAEYISPDTLTFDFTVYLSPGRAGAVCIERGHYPWETEPDSYGVLKLVSDCKNIIGKWDSGLIDSECVEFEYDGNNVLTLKHINAIFNCCPDTLLGTVTFDRDTIIVTERDSIGISGGCDCVCPYDMEYGIHYITPKKYVVKIMRDNFPYNIKQLCFDIDLTIESSGRYCQSLW